MEFSSIVAPALAGLLLAIESSSSRSAGLKQLSSRVQVIVFSLHLTIPPAKRTSLLRILGALLGPTRAAPGCLSAQLLVDIGDIHRVFLIEEWESREQYETQLDSDKLKALVAVIEMSNEAPLVHVDTVTRDEGIESLPFDRFAIRSAAL